MTPRIGITHCAHLADYVEAVRRAGGEPHVIEPAAAAPARVLDTIDGLLLTGGADVDPAHYGEARHPSVEDAERAATRSRSRCPPAAERRPGARAVPRCAGAERASRSL
jgi:gamma-glutamyl-gamma-aminobutyrate hydrolase PuuD